MATINDPYQIAYQDPRNSGANPGIGDLQEEARRSRLAMRDRALQQMQAPTNVYLPSEAGIYDMAAPPSYVPLFEGQKGTPEIQNPTVNPNVGVRRMVNGVSEIANGGIGHGLANTALGAWDAASGPMMGMGIEGALSNPRSIPTALGVMGLWSKGVQPAIDKAGDKLGLDPAYTELGSAALGMTLPLHKVFEGSGAPSKAAWDYAEREAQSWLPLIAKGSVSKEAAAATLANDLAHGFGVSGKGLTRDALARQIGDYFQSHLDDHTKLLPGATEQSDPLIQPIADKGIARLATNAKRDLDNWKPKNPGMVLQDSQGRRMPIGNYSFDDWKNYVPDWLSHDEIMKAREWYNELRPKFEDVYKGDNPEGHMRAFMLANMNASPTDALTNVSRARDMRAGKKMIGYDSAGLAERNINKMLDGEPATDLIGAKLSDFWDSPDDKSNRSWMGNDPRGGDPFAFDVHMSRDSGKVDNRTLEVIRKNYGGDEVANNILVDKAKAELEGPSYEWGSRWGNRLTDHLNQTKWLGIDNWKPKEVQAVGWTARRRALGLKDQGIDDAFFNNSRRISLGLNTGDGSPLQVEHGIKTIPPDIAQWGLEQLTNLTGTKILGQHGGDGAFMNTEEPSLHLQAYGSPEGITDLQDLAGLLYEQTGMIGTKPDQFPGDDVNLNNWGEKAKTKTYADKMKNMGYAFDVVSPWLNTNERRNQFYRDLNEHPTAPKHMVIGYQPYYEGKAPAMRFLDNPVWSDQRWNQADVEAMQNAVADIARESGYGDETHTYHSPVDILNSGHNWEESSDGQGYTSRLAERGRHKELSFVRDQLRGELLKRLKGARGGDSQAPTGGENPGGPQLDGGSAASAPSLPQAVGGIGALAPPDSQGLAPFKKKDPELIPGPRKTESGELGTAIFPEQGIRDRLVPADNPYTSLTHFHPGDTPDSSGMLFTNKGGMDELRHLTGRFVSGFQPNRIVAGYTLPANESALVREGLRRGIEQGDWGKMPKYYQPGNNFHNNVILPYYQALQDSPNVATSRIDWPEFGTDSASKIANHELIHREQFKLVPDRSDITQLLPDKYMSRPGIKRVADALSARYGKSSDLPAEVGAWVGSNMWHGLVKPAEAGDAHGEYVDALREHYGHLADALVDHMFGFKPEGKAKGGIIGDMDYTSAEQARANTARITEAYLTGGKEAMMKVFYEIHGTEEEHRQKYPHLYQDEKQQ